MDNIDKFMIAVAQDNRPIEMITTPARLLILITQLQLALRHPNNTGESATITRKFIENMTEAIGRFHPEAKTHIERGWDTNADMSKEQLEAVHNDEELYDQIRITNASNLLQDYAKQVGRPVILASNPNMHHTEGIRQGNPAQAYTDELQGLTIAIHCNQIEAQIIINGLNSLLVAMPLLSGGHDE
jgi:hypothetical protein